MTGAFDRARSAVETCRAEAAIAASRLDLYADRLHEAAAQLSTSGALGRSDDPNLAACSHCLTRAEQWLKEAAQHLELSRGVLADFAESTFPP